MKNTVGCLYSPRDSAMQTNESLAGPIVRVGPNHLMTSSPDIFRQILIARSKYVRGPWFKSLRLDPNKPQLITESEPVRHDRLRRQMAAGYDGKGIEGFEGAIDENLQNWIKYVEQHGVSHPNESPKEFEIGLSIQYLVTDMICVLCFGFPFGFIAKHADCYDFLKTLMERLPIVEKFSIYTEVCSLLSVVARLPYIKRILPSAKDSNGIGKIMGVSVINHLMLLFLHSPTSVHPLDLARSHR